MKVFKTKIELLSYLNIYRAGKSIGFTPTMGALHDGHLSLIKKSKKECDITICSIFINPTQFNSTDDLLNYPKDLTLDLEKLNASRCDITYIPEVCDLYEKNEGAKKFDFGKLASSMEGKFRPEHFDGMATVVEKLFQIINPTKAFFGEKDLQQLQIVKQLVKQTKNSIEIIGGQTIRERNGLAKSSRNKLLSKKAVKEATLIYKCLSYCAKNKEEGISKLKAFIEQQFKKEKKLTLEYVEFVSIKDMQPIEKWKGKHKNAICIAAYINGVRLIDNIIL